MPGKIVKEVLGLRGKPPEKGSPEWTKLVGDIAGNVRHLQAICALGGGVRKDGWPCESTYVLASGRCRKHFGTLPRGANHHNFIDGRSSGIFKALPKKFRETYMASLKDDDLLSMRADIAVSDVRMEELAKRLGTGESGARWGQVGVIAQAILEEAVEDDPKIKHFQQLARQLVRLHSDQKDDDKSWRDLNNTSQHRRKIVDTERQRLKDLHAYMTAEECLMIVARIADSVVRHVEDRAALTAILREIEMTTGNTAIARGREIVQQ